jgi:diguanylate cyclase (GGDEF)-like protein
MRDDGHEVRTADTLAAAVALIREWKPHVALLDYNLDGSTGADVVAEIRRFDELVQVILVTGFASEHPARPLLAELDIQAYHDKAHGPQRLLVLVDGALKYYRALERADRQRRYLRHILDVSPDILRLQPVPALLQTALSHLGGLLHGADGFVATANSGLFVLDEAGEGITVQAAIGAFLGTHKFSELPEDVASVARVGLDVPHPCAHPSGFTIIPLCTRNGDRGCIVVEARSFPPDAVEACEIYAQQVVQALENVVLYERATVDQLTQVYMRDFGFRRLQEVLRLGARTSDETSVIMLDLDHFKRLNDGYGHAAGDLALRGVASTLRTVCRTTDVIARYGGEEFMIVLPATGRAGSLIVAERLRAAVAAMSFAFEGHTIRVTASLGLASAASGYVDGTALLRSADAALYRAKAQGRNAVVAEELPVGTGPGPAVPSTPTRG